MSCVKYIEFDEEFYQRILVRYADTENFKNLMLSTCDYNSIQDFYCELQLLLEGRKGLFDVYQYYSFALLYEIAIRNPLDGCANLVYQLLLYLNNHGGIEDNIFSSGYVWKMYLMCKNWENTVEKYNTEERINNTQLFDMVEAISDEAMFYDKIEMTMSYEELCLKAQERETNILTKKASLADYFVGIWQHGNEESKFYNEFNRFIIDKNDIDEEMYEELLHLGEADIQIPLNNGYIKKEDFLYIKEQNIDYLAVSQYADGWYLALPFVDVFDLYNPNDILDLSLVYRGDMKTRQIKAVVK